VQTRRRKQHSNSTSRDNLYKRSSGMLIVLNINLFWVVVYIMIACDDVWRCN
jgi:hypothetical protein